MANVHGRRAALEALQERLPQDLDPESDTHSSKNGDDPDSEEDPTVARSHYTDIGKSALRKPKEVQLGSKYQGARVQRGAAFSDSDEEDPFAVDGGADSGDESMSDGPDGDHDEHVREEDHSEADGSDTADTEVSADGDDLAVPPQPIDKSELRRAMAADRSAITTSILAATKSDAEKGRAVKRQRTTYDSFLNVRIKMQKSLIAANSLVGSTATQIRKDLKSDAIIEQAEAAAFDFWSKLTAYRSELSKVQLGSLQASNVSADSSNEELWEYQRQQDEAVRSHHDAVLQKWSLKSRGVAAASQRSRINTERPATIVDVLNEQLNDTDRLVARAQVPRSCAPVQLSRSISADAKIYDDADFYGPLLKELLEAKSSTSSTAAASIDIKSLINIRREAKTKKNVDTKASKGRKLKYAVHEKLQNFCAPDDRTTWSERQRDELFLSLFGQQMELREEEASEDSEADNADASLMLFRSGGT